MSRRAIAPLVALALLGASCAGARPRAATDGPPAPPRCRANGLLGTGDVIPDCAFERFEGGTLRLADLRGRPAVINFWASWCTFCVQEMPLFQRVYERAAGKLEIVGMNLLGVEGETESAAREFALRARVRYPLAFDREGALYGILSLRVVLPMTIFVAADGEIVFRQFGPLDEAGLVRAISERLAVSLARATPAH